MESMLSCSTSHNTCMICLSSLLNHPGDNDAVNDDDVSSLGHDRHAGDAGDNEEKEEEEKEVGAVVPCGHVFHIACWSQWSAHHERCPICQQDATLFCRLYISPPPLPRRSQPEEKPVEEIKCNSSTTSGGCSSSLAEEEDEDNVASSTSSTGNDKEDMEDEEHRRILLDMRTAEQQAPADAIRKVVSLKSKVRKMRQNARKTKEELASTKLVLEMTQEEVQATRKDLEATKKLEEHYRDKLTRIQTQHWQRHRILHEELVGNHKQEVKALQKELEHAKMELAFRNRQIAHWSGKKVAAPKNAFAYSIGGTNRPRCNSTPTAESWLEEDLGM